MSESVIVCAREVVGPDSLDWGRQNELFNAHGMELRGVPAKLDVSRYLQIQKEGRLVYITARDEKGIIQGYSNHYWHRHLHFPIRVAQDDAWYVMPALRNQGIGKRLREKALEELKKDGVQYVYGRLKVKHPHDNSMQELGYEPWETVWLKKLGDF